MQPAGCARRCPQMLWMALRFMPSFMPFVAGWLAGSSANRDAPRRPITPTSPLCASTPSPSPTLSVSADRHRPTPASPPRPRPWPPMPTNCSMSRRVGRDGPGVTVLVARGDQLLYKGARGMASIELGVPMQPDQLMRIGSVTKQFAAATLLKQIDEGKAKARRSGRPSSCLTIPTAARSRCCNCSTTPRVSRATPASPATCSTRCGAT